MQIVEDMIIEAINIMINNFNEIFDNVLDEINKENENEKRLFNL